MLTAPYSLFGTSQTSIQHTETPGLIELLSQGKSEKKVKKIKHHSSFMKKILIITN